MCCQLILEDKNIQKICLLEIILSEIFFFESENSKQQFVSQLQYRSWASRAVDPQVYFVTGLLQCLCDVSQRLMFLSTLSERPEEGLIKGRNVEDSALMPI